jgi:outer membrane receptor protein involved in Fe transport
VYDGTSASFTVADANLGYRFASAGPLKDLSISVNAVNLFDESYISTVGTGGFAIGAPFDDARSLQTLQSGVPRQLFVTVGTSF